MISYIAGRFEAVRRWRGGIAARTIATCSQKVSSSLALTQTALAHADLADLAALRAAGDVDIAALTRVLQGLRDTVRRLRGEDDM